MVCDTAESVETYFLGLSLTASHYYPHCKIRASISSLFQNYRKLKAVESETPAAADNPEPLPLRGWRIVEHGGWWGLIRWSWDKASLTHFVPPPLKQMLSIIVPPGQEASCLSHLFVHGT